MSDFWNTTGSTAGEAPWSPIYYSSASLITTVDIQNGVTNIGRRAFKGLQNLDSISIPISVTKINAQAFLNCTSPNFKSIIIPTTVDLQVEGEAFKYCTAKKIVIGEGGTVSLTRQYIEGEYRVNWFEGCQVQTLILGKQYTRDQGIPPFQGNSWLQNLTIGKNVDNVESGAFNNCSNLKNVSLTDHTVLITFSGSIAAGHFKNCPIETLHLGRNLYLHSNSNYYNWHPFSDNNKLKTVTFGNSVSAINEYSFINCTGLLSITLGSMLQTIGTGAFNNCNILTTPLNLPQGLKTIGSSAFKDCQTLPSVVIPNTVDEIGSQAFNNCFSLKTVKIEDHTFLITFLGSINDGHFKNSPIETLYLGRNLYLHSNSNYYNWHPFSDNSALKTITIGENVTALNEYSFSLCTGLQSLILNNILESIGYSAFYGCKNMATPLNLPQGFKTIGASAFKDCQALPSVFIPNSVTEIGSQAFNNCFRLKTFKIDDHTVLITFSGSINDGHFKNSPIETLYLGRNLYLHSNSNYYNWHPFSDNSALKTVTIGNNATAINEYSFSLCTGLTLVTIGEKVETIGSAAYYQCNALAEIYSNNPTPPIIGNGNNKAFDGVNKQTCKLYVPDVTPYKTAFEWKEFFNTIQNTNISGKIMRPNQSTLNSGIVSLYKVQTLSQYTLVQTVDIESTGNYVFVGVPSGSYIIKATAPSTENALPTYYGNTENWKESEVVTVSIFSIPNINITIIPDQEIPEGESNIEGNVEEDDGGKSKKPVKDANVYLLSFENETIISTTTNAAGVFKFNKLPTGKYTVIVDFPGLDMINRIPFDLSNNTIKVLFTITKEGIKTEIGDVGIRNQTLSNIKIFPNPIKDELRIENSELRIENVEIYDAIGKKVYTSQVSPETVINISHLQSGFYFLRISTEVGEVIKKVLKE
jgi:hypothetical protein